jgi:hypothetical protein
MNRFEIKLELVDLYQWRMRKIQAHIDAAMSFQSPKHRMVAYADAIASINSIVNMSNTDVAANIADEYEAKRAF